MGSTGSTGSTDQPMTCLLPTPTTGPRRGRRERLAVNREFVADLESPPFERSPLGLEDHTRAPNRSCQAVRHQARDMHDP